MKTSVLPNVSNKTGYFLLRSVMGIIFISHGLARLYYGSVQDFGSFLNSQGIVAGFFIAWLITVGESLAGVLFITGYKVQYAVIFNILIIASGILLVHFKNGWFVVGHGQNGFEYSILILAVLLCIYSKESKKKA